MRYDQAEKIDINTKQMVGSKVREGSVAKQVVFEHIAYWLHGYC